MIKYILLVFVGLFFSLQSAWSEQIVMDQDLKYYKKDVLDQADQKMLDAMIEIVFGENSIKKAHSFTFVDLDGVSPREAFISPLGCGQDPATGCGGDVIRWVEGEGPRYVQSFATSAGGIDGCPIGNGLTQEDVQCVHISDDYENGWRIVEDLGASRYCWTPLSPEQVLDNHYELTGKKTILGKEVTSFNNDLFWPVDYTFFGFPRSEKEPGFFVRTKTDRPCPGWQ